MLKSIAFTLVLVLLVPVLAFAKGENGCDPKLKAIAENATVSFEGTGQKDVVILTDPLCWHCRLAHKLLAEYPDKYRTAKMVFFPRRSFIGSDMAAWIIEDAVGTESLKAKIDFAYKHLKQPKTDDINVAREVILSQFMVYFPDLLTQGSPEQIAQEMQKKHEAHVLKSAALCKAAGMPGTPVLIVGDTVVVGYGPDAWLKALDEGQMCK